MKQVMDIESVSLDTQSFSEPWAGRLFGMTIALSEAGVFSLQEFQAAMIETVGSFEKSNCIEDEEVYYTQWLEALQSVLRVKGLIASDRLSMSEQAVTKRLLDLQHERMHHHHGASVDPNRLKPLVVA